MSELLKAYDSYNDFEKSSYFTLVFDLLPSTLFLKLPLEESKENIKNVIETLNLTDKNYELIFKDWQTEDAKNADFSADYPYQLLYKSKIQKSIIWISLNYETLQIKFYYDCNDKVLEEDIIALNHTIRNKFGLEKAPTFKVLTHNNRDFDTEDVRTEKVAIEIDKNYNTDFKQEVEKIKNAIDTKTSGLILLYGKPGTGKTTFIKSLITAHQKSNFIFIQNEFVNKLLEPSFISFLLQQRNSILIIEDAEKVITSRERAQQESVVSTILQLTDGLFSDYLNIKIICTFNTSLSKIDTALLRKGRMITKYEFKELSLEKTNKLLKEFNASLVDEPLVLTEIYNRNEKKYPNLKTPKIGF